MASALGASGDTVTHQTADLREVIKNGVFELSQLTAEGLGVLGFEESPALVVGFVSPHMDFDEVIEKIRPALPQATQLILTSTAGELCIDSQDQATPYCETGACWERVVLQSFSRRMIEAVHTVSVPLGNEDIREGAQAKTPAQRVHAISEQLRGIRLPFAVDYRNTFGYTLIDGLSNSESFFMEAVYETGAFPCLLVGGSAGGKFDFKDTYIFDGSRRRQGCAVVTLIKVAPEYRFGIFKSHNFEKTASSFVVIGGDVTLRTVDTVLDEEKMVGLSLIEALCATLRCDTDQLEAKLADYSFGVEIDNEIYVRSVAAMDMAKKSVRFYCDVDVGDRLFLLRRTDFLATTDRHFERYTVGKPKPIGGILNDCILRRLFNANDLPSLSTFRGIPLAGFSTFGELLGVNINQTLTAVFFHRPREGERFTDPYVDSFLVKYAAFKAYFLERKLAQGRLVAGLYRQVLSKVFSSTPLVRSLTEAYTEALGEVRRYLAYLKQLTADLSAVSSAVGVSSTDNATIYTQIQVLTASMKEIGAISTTVSDIAEQTNILSINAAIQASRAGDRGKAFGVVATEVRKLSVETQKNVEMINATTRRIVASVDDIRRNAEGVRGHLDNLVSANSSIRLEMEKAIGEITEVTGDMERREATSASILGYLHEIAGSESLIQSMMGT